jgi:hypothetical protein
MSVGQERWLGATKESTALATDWRTTVIIADGIEIGRADDLRGRFTGRAPRTRGPLTRRDSVLRLPGSTTKVSDAGAWRCS